MELIQKLLSEGGAHNFLHQKLRQLKINRFSVISTMLITESASVEEAMGHFVIWYRLYFLPRKPCSL